MSRHRPTSHIQLDLSTADALAERFNQRSTADPWSLRMREDNDRDIVSLRAELSEALSSDLELSLEGAVVEDHQVAVPYVNRVLSALQSTYRAVLGAASSDRLRRDQTTLALAGTPPGSFVLQLKVPPEQLRLTEPPLSDRGMQTIIGLLGEAASDASAPGHEWASRASESEVRSMIRLAAALSASRGTTQIRWRPVEGGERTFALSAVHARTLAITLAGETGREILTITGHLRMAQDLPPRVAVATESDDFVAEVKDDEMLEQVKDLLFTEVTAVIAVDTRTSPSTGDLATSTELVELQPAIQSQLQ